MKIYNKFRKNAKALSPVVASIILIAVTVTVSVVVAAWMGGMTIDLLGKGEAVEVSSALCPNSITIILTLRNAGRATVTISAAQATVDGAVVTITGAGSGVNNMDILKGQSADFTFDLSSAAVPIVMQSGVQYDIKLITEKGTVILYPVTCN